MGFRRADLLQSQLPAGVIQLAKPVEATPREAHHLASLADVAQRLGRLQQLLLSGQSGLPKMADQVVTSAHNMSLVILRDYLESDQVFLFQLGKTQMEACVVEVHNVLQR